MAATQQMLQAVSGLQENAQGNLPVIPNNGNPGGAYNMASAEPEGQMPSPQVNPLAWLQPSEYMTNVKQILEQQAAKLTAPPQTKQSYDLITDQRGFFASPTDDYGIPVMPDSVGYPIEEAPLRATNPNDIVLPESSVPAWLQGRIR